MNKNEFVNMLCKINNCKMLPYREPKQVDELRLILEKSCYFVKSLVGVILKYALAPPCWDDLKNSSDFAMHPCILCRDCRKVVLCQCSLECETCSVRICRGCTTYKKSWFCEGDVIRSCHKCLPLNDAESREKSKETLKKQEATLKRKLKEIMARQPWGERGL